MKRLKTVTSPLLLTLESIFAQYFMVSDPDIVGYANVRPLARF